MHWAMAAVLLLIPLFAHALGLGKLVVHSGLDEPLNGEIELLSATTQEIKTIKSSLAPRADFDSAGIELPFFLTGIKYNVVQRNDGRSFLTLSTDEPVREPFVHLLLQVEWSGGKLIREYTALLDPPQWATGNPPEIQTPEVSSAEISDADLVPDPAPTLAQAPAPEIVPVPGEPAANTSAPAATEPGLAEPAPAPMATPEPESTQAKSDEPAPVSETAPAPGPTETAGVTEPPSDSAAAPSPEAGVSEPVPASPADTSAGTATLAEPSDPGFTPESNVRAWASAWEYGPVKKGETLGQISEKLRSDKTLTSKQVMLALLRANPSAFYGKNVNNLKAGMILKVPEREEVETVSKDLATREFQAQYEVWQKYKLQVANANSAVTVPSEDTKPATEAKPAPAPETQAQASTPTKSAKPTTPAKKGSSTAAKSAKESDEDLLKIVRSSLDERAVPEGAKAPGVETRKDVAKEQRALTEKVATLEEAIESKQLQNKEMRDRVGKMQEQVKNTSRLIELENKDLAQAQKQATDSGKTKPAEAPAPEPAPTSAQAVPVPPTEPANTEAPTQPQPQVNPPPSNLPAAGKPKVRPPAASPPPPAEEPSMLTSLLEGITDNSFLLPVLAVVGVLGGGILAMYYVRRRRASAEFEESILSGGGHSTDNSSISNSTTQPGASDTSFLSDFSQGGMGNIHTDEVDPIAEAEVYLAYGRDEQAEEILKEAVVKDPARHELKQKLLEIYHQRNDVGAFETLAEELYAALEGKGGKVWDKVEEMGRKISPSNPMFRGGAPAVGGRGSNTFARIQNEVALDGGGTATAASDNNSLGFEMDDMLHTPPPAAREPAEPVGTGLDFDLGESATPTASGLDLDFNFQENVDHRGQSSNNIDFGTASATDDHEISLDFDTPSATPATKDEGLSFTRDATDNSGLEFESASTSDADVALEEPQWDETATKLDLAKAYIDMGDAEGARSILDEVLAEGNESQKEQARDLAAQIA